MSPSEPTSDPAACEIATRESDGAVTVAVRGEVDVGAAPTLRAALAAARPGRGARLVIDLREVSFIDSSGIGVLVAASKDARAGSTPLEILCGAEARRVIEMAGLGDRLPIV